VTQAWSPIGGITFDVFDFELTTAELEAIDRLDTGVRGGPDPASITTDRFALTIPEA
jgi:2,5-diketo-D-gluconate reductase A